MKTSYAFADVAVLANGVPLTGFGEGDDVIQIARRNDEQEITVGAAGAQVPTRSSDRSAEIILGILQGHDDNATLGAILNLQVRGATFIPLELQITELSSGERIGGKGVIKRPADRNKGTGLNRYDWVIAIGDCEFTEGTLPNV